MRARWMFCVLLAVACDGGGEGDGGPDLIDAGPRDGGDPATDGGDPGTDGGHPGTDGGGPGTDGGGTDGGDPGADAGMIDPLLDDGPLCTTSGWCWETPLPAGFAIQHLWATAPEQVVASGGTAIFHARADGSIFHAQPTDVPIANGMPLWGDSPYDVWALGFRTSFHFDGREWSEESSALPLGSAIHGFDGDDIWAIATREIRHYDGASWSTAYTYPTTAHVLDDVWATAPGEAIVAGRNGTRMFAAVVRADGTVADLPASDGTAATAVYASGAEDVWVGTNSGVYRLVDGAWTEVTTGGLVIDMWGSGPDDVWWTVSPYRVEHWNGTEVELLDLATIVGARSVGPIAGTSSTDVWVADLDGGLHHYDGSSWTTFKRPLRYEDFRSIAATASGEAWAITSAGTLASRALDGTWAIETSPATSLTGVAHAGGETFLFASTGSFRRSGGAWTPTAGGRQLEDACTTSDGITFGVGSNGIARFDGTGWVAEPDASMRMQLVHCTGTEAWASTDGEATTRNAQLAQYDGTGWARVGLVSAGRREILAAFATGTDDAWVVAADRSTSMVMRFTGSGWREVIVGSTDRVLGGGASGPNDVWLVGEGGLARRWDGTALRAIDAAGAPDFEWVRSNGDGTARAFVRDGAVWAYDGSAWREESPAIVSGTFSSRSLRTVAFTATEVLAVGDLEEPLRYRDGAWERLSTTVRPRWVAASEAAGPFFVDSFDDDVLRWTGTDFEATGARAGGQLVVAGDAVLMQLGTSVSRLSGASFVPEHVTGSEVQAVFGTGTDSLWIIAFEEAIDVAHELWLKEGGAWDRWYEPIGMIGAALDDAGSLIVVDTGLAVYRREGIRFVRLVESMPFYIGFTGRAHVYAADDAWAISSGGLLHWSGTTWSSSTDPVGIGFDALTAAPDGTLYAAGRGASIVRRAAP